jgi:hypothetical protein
MRNETEAKCINIVQVKLIVGNENRLLVTEHINDSEETNQSFLGKELNY